MREKYNIEIENIFNGAEASPGYYGEWRNYDTLVSSGNTLDELIDSAEVFLMDQDGGEAGSVLVGDLPKDLYEIAETEIIKQFVKQGGK